MAAMGIHKHSYHLVDKHPLGGKVGVFTSHLDVLRAEHTQTKIAKTCLSSKTNAIPSVAFDMNVINDSISIS